MLSNTRTFLAAALSTLALGVVLLTAGTGTTPGHTAQADGTPAPTVTVAPVTPASETWG